MMRRRIEEHHQRERRRDVQPDDERQVWLFLRGDARFTRPLATH